MEVTYGQKIQLHRYHIHQSLCVKLKYSQYYGYIEIM